MQIQLQPRSLPGAVVKIKAKQLGKELRQAKQPASKAQIKYTSQRIISGLSYFHSIIIIYEKLFPICSGSEQGKQIKSDQTYARAILISIKCNPTLY